MSNKILLVSFLFILFLSSCGKMYDNLEKYAGEIVYPGKFDTIIGRIGYERVEIDLMKAGRIPSSKINLGKALKTVVEYDDKKITIDSLASWINVKDLKMPKLYRFKVYTVDEFGNKSVPQQIALIPYTATDLSSLVVSSPKVLASPSSGVLSWPSGLSSILLNYYGLKYTYTDKGGLQRTGDRGSNPRIFMANLNSGEAANIDITYKIIPKVNGVPILDTVYFPQKLQINIPTGSTPFTPVELSILKANGINTFTADAVANVQKLTFPVHTATLQDIFYFSGLKEIDLTGGTLFEMTKTNYNRNGIVKSIGGGPLVAFARRAGDIPLASAQYLLDLLDLGMLTKVKYIPNSLGIDQLLAPYASSGVIEYVGKPDEALIPLQPFLLDGLVQDNAWRMSLEAPALTYPDGVGLQNVIKATVLDRSGSFVLTIPKEYEFDIAQYKFLRFKVYAPAKSTFSGIYAPFQRLWPRFMNYMWAFNSESSFGQQYWAPNANDFSINDSQLQVWTDIKVDLSQAVGKHNRVIVLNIGGEPSMNFGTPTEPLTFYFANFRFSKN